MPASAIDTEIKSQELFKTVYGGLTDVTEGTTPLSQLIKFDSSKVGGEKFEEAVRLARETGFITMGNDGSIKQYPEPRAGIIQTVEMKPSTMYLASAIGNEAIERSLGDNRAFMNALNSTVESNLDSHEKRLEIIRLYGQSEKKFGRVNFSPSGTKFRGGTFSADGTINLTRKNSVNNTPVSQTLNIVNGVAVGSQMNIPAGKTYGKGDVRPKAFILLEKGDFAPGIWNGFEGMKVFQYDANNLIVADGNLAGVDANLGGIFVDFEPAPATASGSHTIGMENMEIQGEAVGMHRILSNQGSLFGIDSSNYSLYRSQTLSMGGKMVSLDGVLQVCAQIGETSGFKGELISMLNHRVIAKLIANESHLKKHGAEVKKLGNGAQGIEFYTPQGTTVFMGHDCVMESDMFLIDPKCWRRSGHANPGFNAPGIKEKLMWRDHQRTCYKIMSYSNQYLFCEKPANQALITDIDFGGVMYNAG